MANLPQILATNLVKIKKKFREIRGKIATDFSHELNKNKKKFLKFVAKIRCKFAMDFNHEFHEKQKKFHEICG